MSEVKAKVERAVTGRVVSNKADKTITVSVERLIKHAKYEKYIRRTTKFHAHDENNECNTGDLVVISQSRPYSKTKSWVLVNIVERTVG